MFYRTIAMYFILVFNKEKNMYKIKVTTKDGLVVLVSVDNIVNLAEGDFITKVEVIKN